jgi:hypothetical protein
MKSFWLVRDVDVSGTSGTGVVAEGVVLTCGKAVMSWLTKYRSVAMYESIEELEIIHGHNGRTRVVWECPLVKAAG